MPENVFKSVFQSLSVSLLVKQVKGAIRRNERQLMEKIFSLLCQLWALTTMWNLLRLTSRNTVNPLKEIELLKDLKKELRK